MKLIPSKVTATAELPKIVQIVMQRLHRSGVQPKLEEVKIVDSQPADAQVGIHTGYEVVDYVISMLPPKGGKEIPVTESNDGMKPSFQDFLSGRRSNSVGGALAALFMSSDTDLYFSSAGKKQFWHITMIRDIAHGKESDTVEITKTDKPAGVNPEELEDDLSGGQE